VGNKYRGGAVHICSFEAVDAPPLKDGYAAFREAALKAGRFSVFEATENMARAKMYERLCRDPEIQTVPIGFPWTRVMRATKEGVTQETQHTVPAA
jgi:hypothetical protein